MNFIQKQQLNFLTTKGYTDHYPTSTDTLMTWRTSLRTTSFKGAVTATITENIPVSEIKKNRVSSLHQLPCPQTQKCLVREERKQYHHFGQPSQLQPALVLCPREIQTTLKISIQTILEDISILNFNPQRQLKGMDENYMKQKPR